MAATEHRFSRYADVVAALAEPALVPVPPGAGDAAFPGDGASAPDAVSMPAPGTAAWLRATVARFSAGPTHRRRRAVVEAQLDRLDPDALRRSAARAAASAARAGGAPADARLLAVRVLADALGLPDPDAVAADVRLVAGVYFGGDDEAADAAVARLMAVLLSADEPLLPDIEGYAYASRDDAGLEYDGHCEPAGRVQDDEHAEHAGVAEARLEAAANRIGLLVQACDATGALVDGALRAMRAEGAGHPVEAVLAETLRHDPPVRAMRRRALRATQVGGVRIAAGDTVALDIAAANRDPEVFAHSDVFDPERTAPSLTFGAEPRRCPGRHHGFALAAGILDDARTPKAARGAAACAAATRPNRLAEAA
jgi:cytochrome P450